MIVISISLMSRVSRLVVLFIRFCVSFLIELNLGLTFSEPDAVVALGWCQLCQLGVYSEFPHLWQKREL